jgi:murein L,D-transpeptidase YcbB/YkuD
MAEAVLSGKDNQKIVANSWYPAMRERLKEYLSYTRKGGWAVLPPLGGKNKKIKPGISNPYIALVKKRLQQTGQFTESDTSMTYTAALEASVKKVQATHGLKPDGIITSALIDELNIPAAARLQQLLVNMERMRWMPATTKGKLILVNIPEFILHARDGSDTAFNMNIVAGKEGHSTVMFSGSLNQIVFSPYWNLPQSIVEKEVLPGMEKNNNYLEAHDMEITGKEDGIPVIRQLPGEKNELGKVKFLFPNSFNIYFHDTPHKELFSRTNRAFSHGCIRLGDPKKMAQFLLQDQQKWTSEKIDSAMNSGKEQFVQVKEPVPVLIYYYTTWVDDAGNLQWRKDIYGHDGKMARKLFFNPQVIGGRTLAMVAK